MAQGAWLGILLDIVGAWIPDVSPTDIIRLPSCDIICGRRFLLRLVGCFCSVSQWF